MLEQAPNAQEILRELITAEDAGSPIKFEDALAKWGSDPSFIELSKLQLVWDWPYKGMCVNDDARNWYSKRAPMWTLTLGIHRRTLMSRDYDTPRKLISLEACQAYVTTSELGYNKMGCHIWFANAAAPDGKSHKMQYKEVAYH